MDAYLAGKWLKPDTTAETKASNELSRLRDAGIRFTSTIKFRAERAAKQQQEREQKVEKVPETLEEKIAAYERLIDLEEPTSKEKDQLQHFKTELHGKYDQLQHDYGSFTNNPEGDAKRKELSLLTGMANRLDDMSDSKKYMTEAQIDARADLLKKYFANLAYRENERQKINEQKLQKFEAPATPPTPPIKEPTRDFKNYKEQITQIKTPITIEEAYRQYRTSKNEHVRDDGVMEFKDEKELMTFYKEQAANGIEFKLSRVGKDEHYVSKDGKFFYGSEAEIKAYTSGDTAYEPDENGKLTQIDNPQMRP